MKIFQDLDGCLVDFVRGACSVFENKFGYEKEDINDWEKYLGIDLFWITLKETPNFYTNLPWMKDGKELWNTLVKTDHHLAVLTGCPRGRWSEPQKLAWCERELGDNASIISCTTDKKHKWCTGKDCVLIDNREKTEENWVKKGGIFILHTNTENTLRKLRELSILK